MAKLFDWKKPVVKPQETKSGAFHRRAKNFTQVKTKEEFVKESKTHIEGKKK